jgi:outer membrane protein OmpA-like peptidoglycan-associated protein
VGSDTYNEDLSLRRARAAASLLAADGVASSRIRTAGRGETEPVESNDSAEGRQSNRRVEVAIYANEKLKEAAKKQAD